MGSVLSAVTVFVGISTGTIQSSSRPAGPAEIREFTAPAQGDPKMEQGKKVYSQYCIACHQTDGKGVPGAFPPVASSDWVQGDKTRLINVILKGLEGQIKVNDQTYNSVMPAHSFLSDADIAAVLTYVRANFGNKAGEITEKEVAAQRKANEAAK
jgi:mono/diheme cytochrome c family protein